MNPASAPLFIVHDRRSHAAGLSAPVETLAARLQALGRAHQWLPLHDMDQLGAVAGRAVHSARAAGGAVVVGGAPDVINGVLQVVWNARLVLGILPSPAGDVSLAHTLPADPEAWSRARVRELPAGLLGERVFLGTAELGLLAPPARLSPEGRLGEALWTRCLNLAAMLGGRSLLTLELHAQGRARVLRSRSVRVRCPMLPQEDAGSDAPARRWQLEAVTRRPLPLPRAVWRVLRGVAGRQEDAAALDRFAFERLVVRARGAAHPMVLRIDGEPLALHAPLLFQAAPWPLRLLVPGASGAPAGGAGRQR